MAQDSRDQLNKALENLRLLKVYLEASEKNKIKLEKVVRMAGSDKYGQLELIKNKPYFVYSSYHRNKEIFLPYDFSERIHDIIRDRSSDGHDSLRDTYMQERSEEINEMVTFIMADICEMLMEGNYKITKMRQDEKNKKS